MGKMGTLFTIIQYAVHAYDKEEDQVKYVKEQWKITNNQSLSDENIKIFLDDAFHDSIEQKMEWENEVKLAR